MSRLNATRLREVLAYDPETGIFTWIIKPGNLPLVGARAGWREKDGSARIMVDRHRYFSHRLAWLWMTGEWPPSLIDHKDTDRSNNRWKNLRLATQSQNLGNSKRPRNNMSGFKGVRRVNGRWHARIKVGYVEKHLGYFDTPEDAHAAYCAAAKQHFGEFARFE